MICCVANGKQSIQAPRKCEYGFGWSVVKILHLGRNHINVRQAIETTQPIGIANTPKSHNILCYELAKRTRGNKCRIVGRDLLLVTFQIVMLHSWKLSSPQHMIHSIRVVEMHRD